MSGRPIKSKKKEKKRKKNEVAIENSKGSVRVVGAWLMKRSVHHDIA